MKTKTELNPQQTDSKGERGAAIVMVLLISVLILVAGMALVLTTSLSTTTTVDSTAEMQAYAGAEAGLDATMNILRGNVAPDSSLSGTLMNFRAAAYPALSDKSSDSLATGTSAVARMSGWLNYSYQNPSVANDWRVPLTASYAPLNGIAYKVEISDPDDPGPIATRQITTNASYVPSRLVVKSEGYGPKGAIKRLEMIVTYTQVDLKTPGAITMAGSPVHLDLGNSSSTNYTGNDMGTPAQSSLPTVTVSSGNESTAQGAIDAMNSSQVQPSTAGTITAANSAAFLQSADAARTFLSQMRANATTAVRLFSDKAAADAAGGLGTTTSPKFTFIDNYSGSAVVLGSNHQGSGLLIVTGDLETNGNTDFEGIILVLGKGHMTRSGGGNGTIRGTIIVATFDPNGAPGSAFGAPTFSISGAGTSTVGYDSEWVKKALTTIGVSVAGIREYHQ